MMPGKEQKAKKTESKKADKGPKEKNPADKTSTKKKIDPLLARGTDWAYKSKQVGWNNFCEWSYLINLFHRGWILLPYEFSPGYIQF